MPPFIPQKREFSPSSPPDTPASKSRKKPKPSLFETADKPKPSTSLQDNKAFVKQLNKSDSESALSDISSDDFEDALPLPTPKRRKTTHKDEDEDEIDWEDAINNDDRPPTHVEPTGDLELTLDADSYSAAPARGNKKGPSKIERQIRVLTHCMHVQFLLFHNFVRNGWACDKEAQKILIGQLPANVQREVENWRLASGLGQKDVAKPAPSVQKRKWRQKAQNERNQRDWGKPAEKQEPGAPNMSRGDPLIRLLKILAAYWKKRWTVTAPSLRKQGYKPIKVLQEETKAYEKDKHDPEEHGERISDIKEFRNRAKTCEGSRDLGVQVFTALLRGLGLEVRLVASLQPVGFGWSKSEEAPLKKKKTTKNLDKDGDNTTATEDSEIDDAPSNEKSKPKTSAKSKVRQRRSVKGKDITVIEDSENIDQENGKSEDDESVIDVTPVLPRKKPNMNYDRDMVFPTYWAEAVSPITSQIIPVDPLILTPAVATNDEQLASFEPRGAKADKAKQVFAYVVGYSSDGTAKDLTTRYLKRHMWPGRTKGVRLPVEKVPVYNSRGKVKRYEDYDWFKMIMSGYRRTDSMRTLVDDLEETKDLKPVKPEKKEAKAGEDTLQGYKSSAEFVLERHLRREEALRPEAKPVRTFVAGKGDNAKEEPVYRRTDVEVCRTGESWHKEGRAIKAGEVPMKLVPVRAVTLTRKREVEEAERDSGEKPKQGLYSWGQTDWIIPPPIQDGVIPKNAFGNMDCYVPTMVPKGAVHIPLRSTVRICKRLEIDYAEAVTGFEFGNKRAVPVITGVVVAEGNERQVIEVWKKEEEERRIKEEGKREKVALATWRKWLMGLRIVQRVREEYSGDLDAHSREEINPFTNQNKARKATPPDDEGEPIQNGGFSIDEDAEAGGGFLADDDMGGGGFLLEDPKGEEVPKQNAELTIEDDKEPIQHPLRPHIVRADRAHDASESAAQQSIADESDESCMTPIAKSKSKLAVNGKQPSSESKTGKSLELKKPRGRKPKAVLAKDPDSEPLEDPSEPPESPEKKGRAAPKRKAARKSETAVKSHYFAGGGDEESSSDDDEQPVHEPDAEEEVVAKRKRGRPKGSVNGRSLRGRKSM